MGHGKWIEAIISNPITVWVVRKSRHLLAGSEQGQSRSGGADPLRKRTPNYSNKTRYGPEQGPLNLRAPKSKTYLQCGTSVSKFEVFLKQGLRKWMTYLTSQVKIIFRKGKLESFQSSSNTRVYDRRCWNHLLLIPGRWLYQLMWCCSRDNLLQIRKGFASSGLAPQPSLRREQIKRPGTRWPSERKVKIALTDR